MAFGGQRQSILSRRITRKAKTRHTRFALNTMLGIHFIPSRFSWPDLAMKGACFDTPLYREFAQLGTHGTLIEESTILRFRHGLEKHKQAEHILAAINVCSTKKACRLGAVRFIPSATLATRFWSST